MIDLPTERDAALESLTARLNAAVEELNVSAAQHVVSAVRVGEILLAIRPLVSHGKYQEWVETTTELKYHQALLYARLAKYKDRVLGQAASVSQAKELLSGLPRINEGGGLRRYPDWMRDEAYALKAAGKAVTDVAAELGVSEGAVRAWLDPSYNKRKREWARNQSKAREALKREENRKAARKAGDSLGDAYSHLRLLGESLDQAISETDNPDVKRNLRDARNALVEMESHIDSVLAMI